MTHRAPGLPARERGSANGEAITPGSPLQRSQPYAAATARVVADDAHTLLDLASGLDAVGEVLAALALRALGVRVAQAARSGVALRITSADVARVLRALACPALTSVEVRTAAGLFARLTEGARGGLGFIVTPEGRAAADAATVAELDRAEASYLTDESANG